MTELSSGTRDALNRVGTSTLTGILSRRGLRNMFLQDVWPIRLYMARMAGPAFTMRFIPAREDKTATGRGPVQQRAMEECPPPNKVTPWTTPGSRPGSALACSTPGIPSMPSASIYPGPPGATPS